MKILASNPACPHCATRSLTVKPNREIECLCCSRTVADIIDGFPIMRKQFRQQQGEPPRGK